MDWKKRIGYYDYLACVTSTTTDLWPTTRLEAAIFVVDTCFLRHLKGEVFPGFEKVVAVVRQQEKLFRKRLRQLMAELIVLVQAYPTAAQNEDLEPVPERILATALSVINRIRFAETYLGDSEFSEDILCELLWDELPDLWAGARKGFRPYAGTWLDARRGCLPAIVQDQFDESGSITDSAVEHLSYCIHCRRQWEDRAETARFLRPYLAHLGEVVKSQRPGCPVLGLLKDVWHLQASDRERKTILGHMSGCERCRRLYAAYGRRVLRASRASQDP